MDLHVAIYEASHNIVLLQMMRALSGMLRKGVFHNRENSTPVRGARGAARAAPGDLRGRHARDAAAAGLAAEEHMAYTRRVLAEIAAAEARLEIR